MQTNNNKKKSNSKVQKGVRVRLHVARLNVHTQTHRHTQTHTQTHRQTDRHTHTHTHTDNILLLRGVEQEGTQMRVAAILLVGCNGQLEHKTLC